MDIVVIIFLWASIIFYLVLGGADFGAGILELLTSKANRDDTRTMVYKTIGPIWEANHMWLIIAIVILFVGFPEIYSEMSIYLHLPLLIMLFGIIARGTAFVFRHYDAIQDEMQTVYNRIFIASSVVTPFFLGVIAGSAISGHIDHESTTFLDTYVFSWVTWFSFAVGLFTVALCGFLAAVYLIGEAEELKDAVRMIRKAKYLNVVSIMTGILVFIAASLDDVPLISWMLEDGVGVGAIIFSTLTLFPLWWGINKGKRWLPRLMAAAQVSLIVLAITYAHFPDFIITANANNLSLYEHQAPMKTMNVLGWALIIGSFFIIPALFYLMYSFQKKDIEPAES